MIKRLATEKLQECLKYFPCVAIVGPRQVGKTTLVKSLISQLTKDSIYLDLELRTDFIKLLDPETYLQQHADKIVIIDEVQRNKALFPVLRALIDMDRRPGRFILLGSAGPELIRDSSESLAGRIAYVELFPLNLIEVNRKISMDDLWLKGGFPDAVNGRIPHQLWMRNFIRTYLEQDLPMLGFPAGKSISERLWTMLAHHHANLLNYSELSKSLELSVNTVKNYIRFLENTFLIRQLQPYHMNIKKRLVKAPKIYIRDTGILHYFLDIPDFDSLYNHIKMGSSWEGFVIEQIASAIDDDMNLSFFRTQQGAELDLLIEKKGKLLAAIEIKYGSDPRLSKGNLLAAETLGVHRKFVITKSSEEYMLSNGFLVCDLQGFLEKHLLGL